MAGRAQHTNVTTVDLASQSGKKTQSVNDIMQAIESSMPSASQQGLAQQGGLSARLQGRINEHQLAYGDNTMPRGRLPKVDNVLLDRYQAARHNVLVLGAIRQAEGKSKSNTHRSHKSGGSRTPHAAHGPASSRDSDDPTATEDWDSAVGPGSLSAGPSGLDDAFSSFKSRVSSKALGSIAEDALSAQPSATNLGPEPSHTSARRRFNRQGSNSSMASHVSAASYASGLTGVSRASSSGQGRHLREQTSYMSSGGSSGHTLRSHVTASVAGSRFGGHHHKKGGKRKPPKPEPGRVTRAFLEFGAKDDWVSKTLLKHALAAIIQAHWRGYWVRQRWKVNKEQLVLDEQARLEADSRQAARVQELQHKLLLYEQKKLAAAAAEAVAVAAAAGEEGEDGGTAAAAGGDAFASGAAAGGMSRAVSGAWRRAEGPLAAMASWHSMRSMGDAYCLGDGRLGYGAGSDSDSDWSDAELDDVAAIKFRAVTPPWQRVPDRQPMSLALQQRTAAAAAAALGEPVEPPVLANWADGLGGLGSCWDDDDDTAARLHELRHRRIIRKPEPVPLSPSAVAAAASAGLLSSSAAAGTDGSAAGPTASAAAAADGDADAEDEPSAAAALPRAVVEALLLERYSGKFTRLGLPHKMPGRQQWLKMQAEAAAAAAAESQASAGEAAEQAEVAAAAAAASAPAADTLGVAGGGAA